MRYVTSFILLLLLSSLASAMVSQSENYKIDFVIKSSAESESDSSRFVLIVNPFQTEGSGIYGGSLQVLELRPVASAEAGGGEGGSAAIQQAQEAELAEEIKKLSCGDDATFIRRLFSSCKVPGDGVCQDGENFIIDSDCTLNAQDVAKGRFLKQMWFLRLLLAVTLILLIRNSKRFPVAVIAVLTLMVYNGAFGMASNEMACKDVNFLKNFGYCIMPAQPMLGWGIAFAVGVAAFSFFKKRQKQAKPKRI